MDLKFWSQEVKEASLGQVKVAEWDYVLQFLNKLKLGTKLVSRQYIKVLTSKFISSNLYMLVFIFIIYFQSSTKAFSATETLHWITGPSVNLITGVTFVNALVAMYDLSDTLFSFFLSDRKIFFQTCLYF